MTRSGNTYCRRSAYAAVLMSVSRRMQRDGGPRDDGDVHRSQPPTRDASMRSDTTFCAFGIARFGIAAKNDFTSWERISRLALDYLPIPRILHPWPSTRFDVNYPRWKPTCLRRCRSAFNVDCTYWWNSLWRKSTYDLRIKLLWNWFTYCLETIMNVSIDPSRRDTARRAASCSGEQISSAGPMPFDIRPNLHPASHGWRESMIRRAACLRSLNRVFQPGKELEDWLAAEQEIDHLIACGAAPYC